MTLEMKTKERNLSKPKKLEILKIKHLEHDR